MLFLALVKMPYEYYQITTLGGLWRLSLYSFLGFRMGSKWLDVALHSNSDNVQPDSTGSHVKGYLGVDGLGSSSAVVSDTRSKIIHKRGSASNLE